MDTLFHQLLLEWKKPYLRDQDLIVTFKGENTRRYDAVKYAIKRKILIPVRRGLYLIGPPYGKGTGDPFEMAQIIYGPSYVSLESALSFHGWIPEAVYTTTSVSAKRKKIFETSMGVFRYSQTPSPHFFLNVQRITNEASTFLIAEPWKAIADLIYCSRKKWTSCQALSSDMRIENETLQQSDKKSLFHIATYYASPRVCKILKCFYEELI